MSRQNIDCSIEQCDNGFIVSYYCPREGNSVKRIFATFETVVKYLETEVFV